MAQMRLDAVEVRGRVDALEILAGGGHRVDRHQRVGETGTCARRRAPRSAAPAARGGAGRRGARGTRHGWRTARSRRLTLPSASMMKEAETTAAAQRRRWCSAAAVRCCRVRQLAVDTRRSPISCCYQQRRLPSPRRPRGAGPTSSPSAGSRRVRTSALARRRAPGGVGRLHSRSRNSCCWSTTHPASLPAAGAPHQPALVAQHQSGQRRRRRRVRRRLVARPGRIPDVCQRRRAHRGRAAGATRCRRVCHHRPRRPPGVPATVWRSRPAHQRQGHGRGAGRSTRCAGWPAGGVDAALVNTHVATTRRSRCTSARASTACRSGCASTNGALRVTPSAAACTLAAPCCCACVARRRVGPRVAGDAPRQPPPAPLRLASSTRPSTSQADRQRRPHRAGALRDGHHPRPTTSPVSSPPTGPSTPGRGRAPPSTGDLPRVVDSVDLPSARRQRRPADAAAGRRCRSRSTTRTPSGAPVRPSRHLPRARRAPRRRRRGRRADHLRPPPARRAGRTPRRPMPVAMAVDHRRTGRPSTTTRTWS